MLKTCTFSVELNMQIRLLRNNISSSISEIYTKEEAINVADWLIMDVLNIPEKINYINILNKEIDENSVTYKIINQKWKRLLRHEPLQYVLHKAWFYGFEFNVNRKTLIPRPETEEMCYQIIQTFSGQLIFSFIDIGTGSGCIPVVLKKNFPLAEAFATDVSLDALKIAQCNSNKHNVEIEFLQDDIFRTKLTMLNKRFDLLISNPPYIPINEKEKIRPNVKNFEPHIALFVPENEPLLFYKEICNVAEKILEQNGHIFVEVHENFATKVEKLFVNYSYKVKVFNDMQNKPRYLMANRI